MPSAVLLIYALCLLIGLGVGLGVTGLAALRPTWLWPLLIGVSVLASGMMPAGYTIVDEYLTGALVLGALMYLALNARPRPTGPAHWSSRLHSFAFGLLSVYLVAQSLRGLAVLDSPQKIRWVVFYGMLGVLALILNSGRFPVPSRRQAAFALTASTGAYLLLFLVAGLVAELYGLTTWFEHGEGRWAIQTTWWGSTAYAVVPIGVAMPAVIMCLRGDSPKHRLGGWITLLLAVATVLFYDSRVGLLSILACLVVALPLLGVGRLVGVALAGAFVLWLFVTSPWAGQRDLAFAVEDLSQSGSALWRTGAGLAGARDIDRWIHMQVAFSSIGDSRTTWLLGRGFRTHGRAISANVLALYQMYLPERAERVREDESTEGFTALVVDTGLLGLVLLGSTFLLVAWQVLRERRNAERYVLLTSVVFLFLWLFVINLLDMTLYYVAIMPSGLLLLLARPSETPSSRTAPAPAGAVAGRS